MPRISSSTSSLLPIASRYLLYGPKFPSLKVVLSINLLYLQVVNDGDGVVRACSEQREGHVIRDDLCRAIIDDAIAIVCRKSLPFTAMPLMLDHTARALGAIAGNKLNTIDIAAVRKHSVDVANILQRLKAVTGSEKTCNSQRMAVRRGVTACTERMHVMAGDVVKLKTKFLNKCEYLCVSADETDMYSLTAPLAVALQGCDTDFNWGNFFMGQTDVATGKDGAGCYQGVKKVVRKACLDSEVDFDKMWAKICFSVTDGASAMRSTPLYAGLDAKEDGESFVSQFKKDGKPNMGNLHCLCHNLNLALKDALKHSRQNWADDWMRHIRAVYNWFAKSPARKAKFAELSERLTLMAQVVTWRMVYPRYYCPTRWVGIVETLIAICNAEDLHKEHCKWLINQGFLADRGSDDPPPENEEAGVRIEEEEDRGASGPRYHDATFHQFGDDVWDLNVNPIDQDDDVLPLDRRIDLDGGEMASIFSRLRSANNVSKKKSKLLAETTGITDMNLGIDAMMYDALQPYKHLVERLQTQNAPIGHRVCGWILDMFSAVNDFFLSDTPSFGRLFRKWSTQDHVTNAMIKQVKVMGRSFLSDFLTNCRFRLQPYWKLLMALELASPCSAARVAPTAWEGAKDLMRRAGFTPDEIVMTIQQLHQQRREAARWGAGEINHCKKNLLAYYRDRVLQNLQKESKYPLADNYARLVFSLHVASAIIETFFSKTKYIQSKARQRMKVSTVSAVLHISQTPPNVNVEELEATSVSIDVTSACKRSENDLDELKGKYLKQQIKKEFNVDGTDIMVKGEVQKISWSTYHKKFLFHIIYEDGDSEDMYLYELRQFLSY